MIARISVVHSTYFKDLTIIPEIETSTATIKYVGFEKHHDLTEHVIIGFFQKALEISGAKSVAQKFSIPIALGAAYSELTITWE